MIIVDKIFVDPNWNFKNTVSIKTTKALISLIFKITKIRYKNIYINSEYINDSIIQQINFEYRKINKPTDVLSFEDSEKDQNFLSISLYLSYETILMQSKLYNISFHNRLLHLYLHGMLHCFGFDHIKKKEQIEMEKIEKDILSHFNVSPYEFD